MIDVTSRNFPDETTTESCPFKGKGEPKDSRQKIGKGTGMEEKGEKMKWDGNGNDRDSP
jgi:hypothetical protein